jgi:hypothetical protein
MAAGVATAKQGGGAAAFASAAEMRAVLTELLDEVDSDSELGERLWAAHVSHRYVFTDIGLTLDVASSEEEDHNVRYGFDEGAGTEPALTLEMSSEVANRYLQGRENLAIAIARRRIRCAGKSKAVLNLLPINRQLMDCYREVLRRGHPELLLD